jgi:hypothetical protein
MALINLTKEFADGYLEFGLPGLTDGFFKILVSAHAADPGDDQRFRLELNQAGPRHYYRSDKLEFGVPSAETASIEGNYIQLAVASPAARGSSFSSELLISLNPAIDIFSVQARTNSFSTGFGTIGFANWIVSGARAGMETLHSIGLGVSRGNETPSAGVTGWARLFYYPHLVDLQAEIGGG